MRTRSFLISILAAVLTSTAAWATTLSPTQDVLYRLKADKSGWNSSEYPTLSSTDGKVSFECKWSAQEFTIQQYEIPDFATAKTITLTLNLANGASQTGDLGIWNFPFAMQLTNADDGNRSAFLNKVEAITGKALNSTEGDFANKLFKAKYNSTDKQWTFVLNAVSVEPYSYKEDGTTAIVQFLITSNGPNGTAARYASNNDANSNVNEVDLRPKMEVTYFAAETDYTYPQHEIGYRFNASGAWNTSDFPKLGSGSETLELTYASRLYVVEQFLIEDFRPSYIYTLTLKKSGNASNIKAYDFPYALPTDHETSADSLCKYIASVTGATIAVETPSAPTVIPIDAKDKNSDDEWKLIIPGYKMTPIYQNGSTVKVNLLLSGGGQSVFYSSKVENANRPTLVKTGSYPVKIGSNYYANLAAAVTDVTDGQTIELTENTTIASLIRKDGINVTLNGNGYTLTNSGTATTLFLATASGTLTLENLIFDGNNVAATAELVQQGDNGALTIKDATIRNAQTSSDKCVICSKGTGGKLTLDNVTFDNCGTSNANNAVIFIGNSCTLKNALTFTNCDGANVFIDGDKRVDLDKNTFNPTTPLTIRLKDTRTDDKLTVNNWNDLSRVSVLGSWDLYQARNETNHYEINAKKIAVLTLSDSENNATTLNTYDGKRANVTLNRDIKCDGASYATFCVPFAIDAETIDDKFGAGTEVLKYSDTEISGDVATFFFTEENEIEAGVPYLIKPADGDDITSLTFNAVTIDKTERPSADANYEFIPLFSQTNDIADATDAANHSVIYLGASNQLYYAADGADMKGFRAYFRKIGSSPAPARMQIGKVRDQATGIVEAQGDNVQCTKILRNGQLFIIHDGIEYNVMGQMVK